MAMFRIAQNAKITLDGKPSNFFSMKQGLYIRIHLARNSPTVGRVLVADRIEAFTTAPAGTGGDPGLRRRSDRPGSKR